MSSSTTATTTTTADEKPALAALQEYDCEPCLPTEEGTQVKVLRVLDGDSLNVGFYRQGLPLKISLRVAGIDCPEIHSTNRIEKQMGYEAKKRLEAAVAGQVVTLSGVSTDKYGRLLADLATDKIPSVSQYMLEDPQLCKVYMGGHKTAWLFNMERVSAAAPAPVSPKRQLSPKRSPKRDVVAATKPPTS